MEYPMMNYESMNVDDTQRNDGLAVTDEFVSDNCDLIKIETHRAVQRSVESNLKIEELSKALQEAEKLSESQANDLQEIQMKHENLSQLYTYEITKRDSIDKRVSSVGEITEKIQSEFQTLKSAIGNLSNDKENLERVHKNYANRLAEMEKSKKEKQKWYNNQLHTFEISISKKDELLLEQEEKLTQAKQNIIELTLTNDNLKSVIDSQLIEIQKLNELTNQYSNSIQKLEETSTTEISSLRTKCSQIELELNLILKTKEDLQREFDNNQLMLNQKLEEIQLINHNMDNIKSCNIQLEKNTDELTKKLNEMETCENDKVRKLNNKIQMLETECSRTANYSNTVEMDLQISLTKVEESSTKINEQAQQIESLIQNVNNQTTLIEELNNTIKIYNEQVVQLENDLKQSSENHRTNLELSKQELLKAEECFTKTIQTETAKYKSIETEMFTIRKELTQHKEMHKVVLSEYQEALVKSEASSKKQLEEVTSALKESKTKMEKTKAEEIDQLTETVSSKNLETIRLENIISESEKTIKSIQLQINNDNKKMRNMQVQNEALKAKINVLKARVKQIRLVDSPQSQMTIENLNTLSMDKPHTSTYDFQTSDSDTSSQASIHLNFEMLKNRNNILSCQNKTIKRKSDSTSPTSSTKKVPTNEEMINSSIRQPEPHEESNTKNHRFFRSGRNFGNWKPK